MVGTYAEVCCLSNRLLLKVDMPGGKTGAWAAEVVVDQLRGLHSPDDLIVLFMALLNLVIDEPEPTEDDALGFEPQSALGQYLRRCNIGFAELSFEVRPSKCAVPKMLIY